MPGPERRHEAGETLQGRLAFPGVEQVGRHGGVEVEAGERDPLRLEGAHQLLGPVGDDPRAGVPAREDGAESLGDARVLKAAAVQPAHHDGPVGTPGRTLRRAPVLAARFGPVKGGQGEPVQPRSAGRGLPDGLDGNGAGRAGQREQPSRGPLEGIEEHDLNRPGRLLRGRLARSPAPPSATGSPRGDRFQAVQLFEDAIARPSDLQQIEQAAHLLAVRPAEGEVLRRAHERDVTNKRGQLQVEPHLGLVLARATP